MGILEIIGNIKNTEKFLNSSTIFCFPSLWEGYPNSLVEALGFGLPIVLSSRLKYLKDFVENDRNGKVVNDKDYLETIVTLIKNKQILAEMSKKSFAKYELGKKILIVKVGWFDQQISSFVNFY